MTEPRARARSVDEMRALGRQVAELLRGGAFVNEAADRLSIPLSTYYQWLKGVDEAALAFRQEAMAGYYDAAHKAQGTAESDIMGTSERGPSGPHASYHKWLLEKRFPAVFGQQVQQIELTGKDGGPMQVQTSTLSDAEVEAKLAQIAAARSGGGSSGEE